MYKIKRIMTFIQPVRDIKRLRYERVNRENCQELLNYLSKVKTRNEPFHNAIKQYLKNSNSNILFENHLYKMVLKNGLGIIVRNSYNNKIIGAAMNNILTYHQLEKEYTYICQMRDKFIKQNLILLNYHNFNSGILDDFEKIFEIRLLSIDNKYNFNQVCEELLDMCEDMAKRKGFKHIKVDAVNQRAQHFFKTRKYVLLAYTGYRKGIIPPFLFGPNLQLLYKSLI